MAGAEVERLKKVRDRHGVHHSPQHVHRIVLKFIIISDFFPPPYFRTTRVSMIRLHGFLFNIQGEQISFKENGTVMTGTLLQISQALNLEFNKYNFSGTEMQKSFGKWSLRPKKLTWDSVGKSQSNTQQEYDYPQKMYILPSLLVL